ncbi:MAG: hypothetical protein M3Y45_06995 [Actinomycetota bacterium]|nr:hypothetical protein [Actinomycetota bacterium]
MGTRGAANYVVDFDSGFDPEALAGTMAAGLARLSSLNLRTQPGFVMLPGWMSGDVNESGRIPADLAEEISEALYRVEEKSGLRLDSDDQPLTLTVRYSDESSGSPDSAVHGIGISHREPGEETGPEEAAELDFARARFLEGYARLVLGDNAPVFGSGLAAIGRQATGDYGDELLGLLEEVGQAPPADGRGQLNEVLVAIARRAAAGGSPATVTVQAEMGPPGSPAVRGVVFSRSPVTGAPGAIVSRGLPVAFDQTVPLGQYDAVEDPARDELIESIQLAEASWTDMCELEFAASGDDLWFADAGTGRRTSRSQVRIATDLVDDGMVDVRTALSRISLDAMQQLQRPVISRDESHEPTATSRLGSPGGAVGKAAFDPDQVMDLSRKGEPVIYICDRFGPKDRALLDRVEGIMIRDPEGLLWCEFPECPSIIGLDGATADLEIRPGEEVSLDGDRRILTRGRSQLVPPQPDARLARVLSWCDELPALPVLTEAPAGATLVEWAGDTASFRRELAAVTGEGSDGLHLKVAPGVSVIRESLPEADWVAVVADPSESWMATLLAAKLALRVRV